MKTTFKKITIIFFVSVLFISCKKITLPYQVVTEAKTILNVAYGTDALQKMDVYLPQNRTTATKVIIFVHGGSFIGGDKNDFTTVVEDLVRRDFAVMNLNYRLVDGTGLFDVPVLRRESAIKIKNQIDDMSTAVDYVIGKAAEWQVSASKIGMAGHSAGASLSLLYSYDARNTNKIKAVANLAGALDQTFTDIPFYQILLPANALEAGYRYTGFPVSVANDVYYRAISPLYVANASQKIPTLTVFPENNDVMGLPKQGRPTFDAFTSKLNSLGIPNKFVQVAGADHEFSKPGNFTIVLNETVAYFTANLN
jgi:acetyl esterase/lipase